jgi:hypothetical protein
MFDKNLVAQLSGEIQQRISAQMETDKMERMQKFATDDKIDSTGLMAFVLSEAKLFTTLYTTDFLMTLAEYEEMDQKLADGTLELPEMEEDDEDSDTPLQKEADWKLYRVGDAPPENLQVTEEPEILKQSRGEE